MESTKHQQRANEERKNRAEKTKTAMLRLTRNKRKKSAHWIRVKWKLQQFCCCSGSALAHTHWFCFVSDCSVAPFVWLQTQKKTLMHLHSFSVQRNCHAIFDARRRRFDEMKHTRYFRFFSASLRHSVACCNFVVFSLFAAYDCINTRYKDRSSKAEASTAATVTAVCVNSLSKKRRWKI